MAMSADAVPVHPDNGAAFAETPDDDETFGTTL
jgi:hypothetical protein